MSARQKLTLNGAVKKIPTFEDMPARGKVFLINKPEPSPEKILKIFPNMPELSIPLSQNPVVNQDIESYPIKLFYGKEGHGRAGVGGYGACHILHRHKKELEQGNHALTPEGVISFIEEIFFSGLLNIYFESIEGKTIKIMSVSSTKGSIIFQYFDEHYWSIVTAYRKTTGNGTRIARHLFPKETPPD